MTVRTLDAEDLEVVDRLRDLIQAIDDDIDVPTVDALLHVEKVRQHLRSKYYDRPQELKS